MLLADLSNEVGGPGRAGLGWAGYGVVRADVRVDLVLWGWLGVAPYGVLCLGVGPGPGRSRVRARVCVFVRVCMGGGMNICMHP